MQIKFYKMAKNDGSMIFHANTIQENKRILQESKRKSQVERKHKEDFDKLFIRLNHNCQIKLTKEEGHVNSWYNKNVVNYTYGPISGFPSGSWWGIRMDCSRDHVHAPFNEDVQNGPFGVTSVCTSNINVNEDVDFGDSLTLTGQKYFDKKSGKDPLVKNYENQIPVRLIRSYNLSNEYAPKTGYRYDGLYIVTDFWIGVSSDSTKYYKFSLARLSNQESPPWKTKLPSGAKKSFCTLYPVPKSVKNSTESPSLGTYEFRKYSHGSNNVVKRGKPDNVNEVAQLSDIENKRVAEKQKGVSESAIVTRHVFKKTGTNVESTATPSTSSTLDSKSLSHIGTQVCKAHSTNISIRTGLYDSSHSIHQDIKKSISLPFCRTTKPVNILKTNLHMENFNLSNRDKCKTLEGKAQLNISNELTRRVDYSSPNTVKLDLSKIKSVPEDASKEPNTAANDTSSHRKPELYNSKTHNGVANETKEMLKNNINSFDTSLDTLKLIHSMNESESLARKIVPEEVQELRALESLDSLTPDKILHLISQEKYHPLSKLLMGNMIGLTSEQSIALKTREPMSQPEGSLNNTEESIEKTNFKATSEDLIGGRSYKFRRRKRLSRRMLNKSEVTSRDKTAGTKLQKDSTRSLNVLGQSSTLLNMYNGSQEDASNRDILHPTKRGRGRPPKSPQSTQTDIENRKEVRTRLRALKATKSTVEKYRRRKKRREIANLSIDANVGPKVRGPRNRRLRSINNVYTKRSYEPFSTVISSLNKCTIRPKVSEEQPVFKRRTRPAQVNGYERIRSKQTRNVKRSDRLRLKQSRTYKNHDISVDRRYKKVTDKVHRIKNDLSNNNIKSGDDNNEKSKTTKVNVKSIQTMDTMQKRGRKRKSIEPVPAQLNCNSMEEDRDHDKQVTKRDTTDAITQCSLITEPLSRNSRERLNDDDSIRNDSRNELQTYIKTEYTDPQDMKPEMYETIISDDENYEDDRARSSDERYNYCTETEHRKSSDVSFNSNVSSTEGQESPMERVSAFVPVNLLDSDLRIARLRSIGFKPITSYPSGSGDGGSSSRSKDDCAVACTSKVMKQDVAEKYNKYTNEENNVVIYMDDELQFQDIEDEDAGYNLPKRCKASVSKTSARRKKHLKNEHHEKERLEEDLESPWHGWKKVVTNEDSYWIGW